MSKGFSRSSEELSDYVQQVFHPEDAVLREIRERAASAGLPNIHIGVMDGLHLEVLVRAFGAAKIVEIGTLAGYSGVCMARGLSENGRLDTFEFEPHHAEVARESFRRAGVADKVRVFVGPAIENLRAIESEGPFDLVFIDADKESYPEYFEWSVRNLRPGGVILADNTLAGGQIVDGSEQSGSRTKALRSYNERASSDPRVRSTLLPTSDGLTVSVKI